MTECVICMQKIKDKVITPCNHQYCRECILRWIVVRHNCPVCRTFLMVKGITGRQTRTTAALTRIYGALERFTEGPRNIERMKEVFDIVLEKKNKILIKNNREFRIAYNEKVIQAENIYNVNLEEYYYSRD